MKLTPSSTARRRTRTASSGSFGSPQTPGPVSCIEPKPSRLTRSVPPISKLPERPARVAVMMLFLSVARARSAESGDAVRRVLGLQVVDLVVGELQVDRGDGVADVLGLGRADDRR